MSGTNRNPSGFSIVEALVATIIFVASMALIGELVALIVQASQKTYNKTEGIFAARNALNRIATDVRAARNVGDQYGFLDKTEFPATENPIYGLTPYISSSLDGQMPGPPWLRMKLSEQILVLQIPILHKDTNLPPLSDGFPTLIKQNSYGSKPTNDIPNVDTVVYQVVSDPERTNEFMLQVARFPGDYNSEPPGSSKTILPPQTILKGLVGPKRGNSIAIFSYLVRDVFGTLTTSTNLNDTRSIRGVAIDLEIRNASKEQINTKFAQYLGVRAEAMMRNYSR